MDNSINPQHQQRVRREQEVVEYGPTAGVPPVSNPEMVDARSTHADYGDARVDNYQQTYMDPHGNLMERQEQVLDDPYTRRLNGLDRTTQIIYFIVGVVEVILLLRFVFKLLGADAGSGLVSFIYGLTNPLVVIFSGILGDYRLSSTSMLEISTLLAMALYALLGWGLVSLLKVVLQPNPSSRQTFSATRRRD